MVTFVASNNAMHPKSHSWPMDIRAFDCNCGNMCAFPASGGRCLNGMVAVCVATIVCPSGSRTCRPWRTLVMSFAGVVHSKKWLLQPVSAIALSLLGAGSIGVNGNSSLFVTSIPSPGRQVVIASCCLRYCVRPRLLPSNLVAAVASTLCPSAGLVHVALV